jgi:RNA polymerase sigma-32 factor
MPFLILNLDNLLFASYTIETMTEQIKPALPAIVRTDLSDGASFARYMREVQKFPILSAEEEYDYAVSWRDNRDRHSAEMLISSHLRMVVSAAYDMRNYGIPIPDLVASGNLGLMQALYKFDPEKGFRFSTYAMFWIRAEMFDMILSNWSMSKIGTSANHKKVFFNLAKAKRALGIMDGNMSDMQTHEVAEYLGVSDSDVTNMSIRMSARDLSLNRPLHEEGGADVMSSLADNSESVQTILEDAQMRKFGRELLQKHMANLPERDKEILIARKLSDPVQTLEQLADKYGISKERVRQLEERAYEKLKKAILADAGQIT